MGYNPKSNLCNFRVSNFGVLMLKINFDLSRNPKTRVDQNINGQNTKILIYHLQFLNNELFFSIFRK